tara:strand:- start:2324 stop:2941 length:618 start_codon:yes stop_codon:yes gene_type:complete
MNQRNINWLIERRIIFRRDPINDKPTIETHQYKYYEYGTYECYHLFNSKAKITTYKSLKWHMFVLYYLNEELQVRPSYAKIVFNFIADKQNGFVTFFIKNKLLEEIIQDVLILGGEPPKNKRRKIIFKMSTGLSTREKLSIVGKLIGRSKLDKETLYQGMIDINSDGIKITMRWLAELLGVSKRTVYRHMCEDLRREKEILNEEL